MPATGLSEETQRIRTHLARTERALRARDVSHLSPERRAARARAIDALAHYWRRGIFPHNHDFPGERRPYFVDTHGTLCAMAYVIARSGERELVRRIAVTRNNAYLHELADDPALVAWLDRNGLTAAEAARIQPTYGWRPGLVDYDAVDGDYALGSFITAGLGGASIVLNWPTAEPRDDLWPAVLGSAAGIYGIALGASGLGDADGRPGSLAALNLGIGAASAALAGRAAWLALRDPPDDAAAADRGSRSTRRIAIAPTLVRDGSRTVPGLSLRIGF